MDIIALTSEQLNLYVCNKIEKIIGMLDGNFVELDNLSAYDSEYIEDVIGELEELQSIFAVDSA